MVHYLVSHQLCLVFHKFKAFLQIMDLEIMDLHHFVLVQFENDQ